MRFKYISMAFVVFALLLTALACGSDDDTGGNGDEPTATAQPDGDEPAATAEPADNGNGGGGFGSGTGTLTIGDETWEITGVGCVFSAEEAGNPDFPFNLAGFGESSTGVPAQLSVDIYDPSGQERLEGDGVTHSISFYDSEDFANPSLSWESIEATGITIDGKTIHGEGTFDDGTTDEFETVPGTMDVSCP
jgi:hypothetical protein